MNKTYRGVLIFAVVMSIPAVVSAQAAYAIDKGSITRGGEASLSSDGDERYEEGRTTVIRISPDVMYFVVPHLAVGGSLGLSSSSHGGNASTTLSVGPAVGVWFGKPDDRLFPFVTVNLWLAESQSGGYATTRTRYQGSAGVDLMLARNVALTTELSYLLESYSYDYDESAESYSGNQIVFGVGFRAFVF